ncbi:hypothetical protein HMPREF1046_0440 [Streptococcus pseudopneumoniae ATCC BAA-960 = CCUG 49455]|nr:hypothetical protein HMPREF1046_0440 [Streptococcus pseudopneumoniae ATCC BAA-960 = CCUG 49455]
MTLQHCLGHAIICNSHLFSFLLSVTTIVTHSPCILGVKIIPKNYLSS